MKRQRPSDSQPPIPATIPPQLKSIIQKELGVVTREPLHVIVRSIEQAKQNELKAYLTLCQVRLQLPSQPNTQP
jgi:hypothetical protein